MKKLKNITTTAIIIFVLSSCTPPPSFDSGNNEDTSSFVHESVPEYEAKRAKRAKYLQDSIRLANEFPKDLKSAIKNFVLLVKEKGEAKKIPSKNPNRVSYSYDIPDYDTHINVEFRTDNLQIFYVIIYDHNFNYNSVDIDGDGFGNYCSDRDNFTSKDFLDGKKLSNGDFFMLPMDSKKKADILYYKKLHELYIQMKM